LDKYSARANRLAADPFLSVNMAGIVLATSCGIAADGVGRKPVFFLSLLLILDTILGDTWGETCACA
jgi:hypothetical protein